MSEKKHEYRVLRASDALDVDTPESLDSPARPESPNVFSLLSDDALDALNEISAGFQFFASPKKLSALEYKKEVYELRYFKMQIVTKL
jgi:hypothetical protein